MQTFTSFGTNLTNTYSSQSPSNKFRFNQRVSFFEEKTMNSSMSKTFYTSKEDLKQYILSQQEKCQWVDYAEFNSLEPGDVIVTLLSHYNSSFKSTGWDETIDEFNQKISLLVESVKRRFPFIKLLRKVPQEKDLKTETFIQIQLYIAPYENQEKQMFVLFQTGVNESNQLKPKTLIDSIQLFLRKFTLIVQVDCENKEASAIGNGGSLGNGNLLEGLKVSVRQREITETQIQSPTQQIVIKTSLCNLSASKAEMRTSKIDLFKIFFQANENLNLDKQVRVYFSPTKTQNWMTQTNISQGDLVHKDYKSSGKKCQVSQKKEPVKLFVQSVETNYLEQAIFPALVQQINNYEIEVSGQRIKQARTVFKVDQLLQNRSDQQLIVSLRVERNDITKCLVQVRKERVITKEVCIKVSKDNPIDQEGGYELINQFDENSGVFFFWGSINSQYFLEISKKDCFTQQKQIFIQSVSHQPKLEFDLVSCVQTQLWFKAFDVTAMNFNRLEGVSVNINQSEDEDQCNGTTLFTISSNNSNQGSITGQTDKEGMFSCNGLMFKQVHIIAKKSGYLTISYDYDVRSNSTGSILSIPMMPDYYSLINQYHIIVYIPRRKDFKLDFSLKCPDNIIINENNLKHKSHKTKLEIQKVGQEGRILNFQVHVQSLDPFIKNNIFQFIVVNQAPKRQMLCSPTRQQSGKSPTRQFIQPQETFLKTRISLKGGDIVSPRRIENDIVAQKIVQYCAEDSVRVFITFGHEVIHTFMIQQSLLPTSNEKCYGVIDLDKRKFTFQEDTIQNQESTKSLKNLKIKNKQEQQLPNNNLGQILSLITNQKIKVKE